MRIKKKPQTLKPILTFAQAVSVTPDIATGFRVGLAAFLEKDRHKIEVANTSHLQGSVNIDLCTTSKYPNDFRWDYALAYKTEVFFVEVHSAHTSEVRRVIRKYKWLKDWLHSNAPEINKLRAKSKNPFIWIQSKNFQIPKNTPQYLAAAKEKLLPIRKLRLS